MRVEQFSIGDILHVVKRGAKGMDIVRDDSDRWHFARSLYLLNDEFQTSDRHGDRYNAGVFERPKHWPERRPLTSILAWTLMPNHFHMLLCETKEGGISKFMHRLGTSMTMRFNEKYQEQGSIFQGAYRARRIDKDNYLQYVFSYVVVKNVMELAPGGLTRSIKNFERSWVWASRYPFSSFRAAALGESSPIVDRDVLDKLGLPGKNFKRNALDMLTSHTQSKLSAIIGPPHLQ